MNEKEGYNPLRRIITWFNVVLSLDSYFILWFYIFIMFTRFRLKIKPQWRKDQVISTHQIIESTYIFKYTYLCKNFISTDIFRTKIFSCTLFFWQVVQKFLVAHFEIHINVQKIQPHSKCVYLEVYIFNLVCLNKLANEENSTWAWAKALEVHN